MRTRCAAAGSETMSCLLGTKARNMYGEQQRAAQVLVAEVERRPASLV